MKSSPNLLDFAQSLPTEALQAELTRRAAQKERDRIARDADAIRARCIKLSGFVREAWPILHPGTAYVHGWHIDLICEHLEAITFGRLLQLGYQNRLLINEPPGTMKSLLVNVFWTAWEWGPAGMPWLQNIATSYREEFCKRDSRRARDLVASEWYQSLWGDTVKLTRTGESSFENSARGWYEAIPFGSLTGGRAHRVKIDDPHSIDTAESEPDLARASMRFRESVPLRLNDPITSAIVLVMQRLKANDLSGVAIALKLGYVHIMLPMEFELDRRCTTPLGRDPRTYDGELLFPERFPRAVVDRDKVPLGSYGVAGQFQQRPAPREGGMFKRAWFAEKLVKAAPEGTVWVRHWDLAASTRSTSPFTAGVKMGRSRDGRYYVGHVARLRAEGLEVRHTITAVAGTDTRSCAISLPQDPGQAGKVQVQDMIAMLAGFVVHAEPETGDKESRAEPFAVQCEAGNVFLVEGPWVEAYLDELCAFPSSSIKDQVDGSSGAFARLLSLKRPIVISDEFLAASRMPGPMQRKRL